MGINSVNSNSSMNWLFSSNQTESTSAYPSVSDYSLISSGAYKKLLNAYYAPEKGNTGKSVELSDEEKKEKINLATATNDARSLADNLKKLNSTEVTEDNRSSLKESLKSVVESYNSLVDSGSEVDNTAVLRNVLWMTKGTSENSGLMQDIGITIGEGNKLSFDEDKFDKAALSTVKSLTTGVDSFFNKLASRATTIQSEATAAVNKDNTGSVYSRNGMKYDSINPSSLIDKLS